MSAAEMLVALYFEELNIDPQKPHDESRDRFVLSEGHSSIGYSKYWPTWLFAD